MPKHPDLHPYSDRRSFDRLMLMIAAIAANPGIASKKEAHDAGVDCMDIIQGAMTAIAPRLKVDYKPHSVHTLKKDVGVLKKRGIIPSGKETATRGFYIGLLEEPLIKLPPKRLSPKKSRKSKLTDEQIKELRSQKLTYQKIADQAGISRSRVEQIVNG